MITFPEHLVEEYFPGLTIRLVEKRHEFDDIYTFIFTKPRHFDFYPGQNVRLAFPKYSKIEEKPLQRSMSMASDPSDPHLMFSMRTSSNSFFKKSMMELKEGDELKIIKRKGATVWPIDTDVSSVLIAGGLGITPFRSMLFTAQKEGLLNQTSLIHVSRNQHLYKQDLSLLPCKQTYIGRKEMRETIIQSTIENPDLYYLIGSPSFIESVKSLLNQHSVKEDQIITSRFSGYKQLLD